MSKKHIISQVKNKAFIFVNKIIFIEKSTRNHVILMKYVV